MLQFEYPWLNHLVYCLGFRVQGHEVFHTHTHTLSLQIYHFQSQGTGCPTCGLHVRAVDVYSGYKLGWTTATMKLCTATTTIHNPHITLQQVQEGDQPSLPMSLVASLDTVMLCPPARTCRVWTEGTSGKFLVVHTPTHTHAPTPTKQLLVQDTRVLQDLGL